MPLTSRATSVGRWLPRASAGTRPPRDPAFDATPALLREGYAFLANRRRRLGDVFDMRLFGMRTMAMGGQDAAAIFYDPVRFERTGALPRPIRATLFGEGGVQMLDGTAHHHRKAMFMSLMSPSSIESLSARLTAEWRMRLHRWTTSERIVLFDEMQESLCRAGCDWAGVSIPTRDVGRRARDFTAMVDGFGSLGPRHLRGRRARDRMEAFVGEIVARVRRRKQRAPAGSALEAVCFHHDLDGVLLPEKVAAVEWINFTRPIVAIATYVAFAALALHDRPDWAERIRDGGPEDARLFVDEVRRFYPFTPFLGARVRETFEWRGIRFPRHRLVLLDVYGTDHDERRFEDADRFAPERFEHDVVGRYDLIPQGGGDAHRGHRCAGEDITKTLLGAAVVWLTRELRYEIPAQDLAYSLARMPTRPSSGVVLTNLRPVH